METITDKPQDKTCHGGSNTIVNIRDLTVIAAPVLITVIAIIAAYSLKGNNTSCVCCDDKEDPKLHCERLQKVDLLEKRIKELTKELQDTRQSIRERDGSKPVLVDVKLKVSRQAFWAGTTIKFNHPVINSGNAYHTDQGIFEPPMDGIYSISVTICTYVDTWMLFGVIKDGTVMDEMVVGDRDWHQCATSTTNTYIRHFSLLNVNAAGACGYDFLCDGGRLVRAYVRLR